jgi:chitin synthase
VQLDGTLSALLHGAKEGRARLWTVTCVRPNDSGSANSFDKRRVRAQLRSLLVPAMVQHVSGGDYVAEFDAEEFCARYVPTMRGSTEERIEQCARAGGWREGADYRMAGGRVWVEYGAWKGVEDVLRAQEKSGRGSDELADEADADEEAEYTRGQHGYEESVENLHANPYGSGGLRTPVDPFAGGMPAPAPGSGSGWAGPSDYKGSPVGTMEGYPESQLPSKDGHAAGGGFVQKDALLNNTVEEVPSSRARRIWLAIVWTLTFVVPSFLMKFLGRMKRPDVRLAWREKLAIFILIFFLNALVIFYIVIFGRLLCPNFNKAWGLNEVAQHTGTTDYWVTIQGSVYDVSNFVQGDHSDINSEPSNSVDILDALAGQDLTYYFPVPLTLGKLLIVFYL